MNKKSLIIFTLLIVAIAGLVLWRIQWSRQYKAIDRAVLADPIQGSETAPVKIVVYSDFACSSCRKMSKFLKQAQTEFGDQIAIQFKDFPLTPINPNAMNAAEAGQCAFQQNAFWEYHDMLFERQNQWVPERDPALQFLNFARELRVHDQQFKRCLENHEQLESVQSDLATGEALQLYQTPILFINNKEYTGVSTYESLAKEIRDKLPQ